MRIVQQLQLVHQTRISYSGFGPDVAKALAIALHSISHLHFPVAVSEMMSSVVYMTCTAGF